MDLIGATSPVVAKIGVKNNSSRNLEKEVNRNCPHAQLLYSRVFFNEEKKMFMCYKELQWYITEEDLRTILENIITYRT